MNFDIYQRIMLKINVNNFKSENWEVIDNLLEIVRKLKFTEEEITEAGLDEASLKWETFIDNYEIDLSKEEIKLLFNEVFVLFNNKKSDIFLLIKLYEKIFEADGVSGDKYIINITDFDKFEGLKTVLLSLITEETSIPVLKTLSKYMVEFNVINKEILDKNGISYEDVDENNIKITADSYSVDVEVSKELINELKDAVKELKLDVNSYSLIKEVIPGLLEK